MPNKSAKNRKMLKKKRHKWCEKYGRTHKQIESYRKKHGNESVPELPK